jgi:hypothetical protein
MTIATAVAETVLMGRCVTWDGREPAETKES